MSIEWTAYADEAEGISDKYFTNIAEENKNMSKITACEDCQYPH